MYSIDTNELMNGVVLAILGTFVVLLLLTLGRAALRGRRGRAMSYLVMLTTLFGLFAATIAVLGVKGRWGWAGGPPPNVSSARPWHFFLDMKYQPKYTAQGESRFFADGREMRLPVGETVPFDGTDYFADAGRHTDPNPDFLKADRRYFFGVANADAVEPDGTPKPLTWADGKPQEGHFVARVPATAVERAGGWGPLVARGQHQFNVNCAVCHGASARGGGGPGEAGQAAWGVTGMYGMPNIANLHQDRLREVPDGDLFNTITNGKNTMSAYGHQVAVQDRWAIVAYLRTLQYAQSPPKK